MRRVRDSDIFEAINYAVRNGADVINMSLGGCGSCSGSQWQTVLNSVTTAGVTVVVAAGNYGNSAGCADYGISGINPTLTPASCSGIITVGATDFTRKLLPFRAMGAGSILLLPEQVSVLETIQKHAETMESQAPGTIINIQGLSELLWRARILRALLPS